MRLDKIRGLHVDPVLWYLAQLQEDSERQILSWRPSWLEKVPPKTFYQSTPTTHTNRFYELSIR